jgi:hypothetical protein
VEVRYIKLTLFIVTLSFSNALLRAKEPVSCRDSKEFKALVDYTKYTLNKSDKKVKETITRGPMVRGWSNLTGKLHEIFFSFTRDKFKPDRVLISYIVDEEKKLISEKEYKMVAVSSGLLKVGNFKFNDGVRDKKYRPAHQYYKFMKEKRVICQIKVSHHHAIEYEPVL